MLKQAKLDYCSDKVPSCGTDQKSLLKVTKHLLQGSIITILPSGKSSNEQAQAMIPKQKYTSFSAKTS